MSGDAVLTITNGPFLVRLHPDAEVRDEWGGALYEVTAPFLDQPVKFSTASNMSSVDLDVTVTLADLVAACLRSPDRTADKEAVQRARSDRLGPAWRFRTHESPA